jgi:HEAT repeat protein
LSGPLTGGAGAPLLPETAIRAVVISVLALFVLTVLFALLVLFLRTRHVRGRRRREDLAGRWRDLLLDVLGGERPESELTAAVRPGEELAFLAFLLPFARRVKGQETDALHRLAAPSLPRMEHALARRSAEIRAVAVQTLGAFGMPEYAPQVVGALDDPSPYVAMTAAQALARREHASYANAVVGRLWRFTSWSVELLSAMLARVGPTVAPALRAVLADSTQPSRARAAAADALRRLNDPAAADVAARILPEEWERRAPGDVLPAAALRLLAQVGRAEHAPIAETWLVAKDPLPCAEAVRAFAALAGPGEVASLAPLLRDPHPHVAHETAAALLRVGRADLVEGVAQGGDAAALVARQALAERGTR